MSRATDAPDPTSRSTAWWRLLVVTLVVAVFAAGWVSYARSYATAAVVYQAPPPGQSVLDEGAEYRVLAMQQAPKLRDDTAGELSAAPNTIWVRAEVEVTLRQPVAEFYCARFDLLGAQGRRFDAESGTAYRPDQPRPCSPEDVSVGRPFRYELLYVVPTRDVEALYGLVDYGVGSGRVQLVLRPPLS